MRCVVFERRALCERCVACDLHGVVSGWVVSGCLETVEDWAVAERAG